jgi:hypothetical protein
MSMDYDKLLHAFERGIDDGFFRGAECWDSSKWGDFERASYKRGYDHGVWMYCEQEQETDEFPTDESRSYGSHLNERA